MKQIFILLTLCLTVALSGCQSSKPLSPEKQAQVDAMSHKINNFNFVFTPRNIKPMQGRSLDLPGGFYLDLSPTSVRAYLPYLGRAYVIPTNPMSIGVDFTTTKFEYTSVEKKNGLYEIKITPQDLRNQEDKGMVLYLTVNSNGYGSLSIQFTNRQSISYYGSIN